MKVLDKTEEEICDEWYKKASKRTGVMCLIMVIFVGTFSGMLYISDNSKVIYIFDYEKDIDFNFDEVFYFTEEDHDPNTRLYISSNNITFEPYSMNIWIGPEDMSYLFQDETEITQFIGGTRAEYDLAWDNFLDRMRTMTQVGYSIVNKYINDKGNYKIELEVSTNMFVAFQFVIFMTIDTFDILGFNITSPVTFFDIKGHTKYNANTGRYGDKCYYQLEKLNSLIVSITNFTIDTNWLQQYIYAQLYHPNFVYEVPPYPFIINTTYSYNFNLF